VRLILASASPRRAELLRAAGYTFEVVAGDVDESIRQGEAPSSYVRRLAADKSAAVQAALVRRGQEVAAAAEGDRPKAGLKACTTNETTPQSVVQALRPAVVNETTPQSVVQAFRPAVDTDLVILGADTAVVVDGDILGKPRDDDDGRDMLRRLSGKTHQVMTGVSVRHGAYEFGRVETTAVLFRALTDEDIDWYVASGEGRDKAGGYAIQGLASRFAPSIAGSYANVVGLPVACVDELLRSLLASRL
jgi:septum formation protein